MGSRFFHQRPENAISKAEEFIAVGKSSKALDTLYDVIKSKKRHHNYSEKLIEQIMFKYLELCVDLKKSHIAKEGLFQYRNMCQLTNVASLASVVQGYLTMAEKRTEAARQESVDLVAEVDDLDNLNTPEMIMLNAVCGEDAQDRSDRKILMPWVKFLWESYCQCLELLRTNSRVERLYHDIAQQAFRFCLKYQRKTEFRKLCDKLRNHLELVVKQTPSPMSINLNSLETQQMNLDTRLSQLDSAIQMELWQEAYKAVEDVNGLMNLSKKVFQPKMLANYYQKLALVFMKSGNQLFHAAAVFKNFQLTRDMKKNISHEEHGKMASKVLVACLSVPIPSHHPEFDKFIETDRTPQEKMARLALLLSLQQPPTRQSLLKDAVRFGVVQAAIQPLKDLYNWLEVEFHPLKLCSRVEKILKFVESSEELSSLQPYLPALREITLVRLLKQVSQVYQSICFSRLLKLAPFVTSFELERIIVDCVRHNDMQIRVDHRSRSVHFGTNLAGAQSVSEAEGPHLQDMPSEQVRTQLMLMMEVLDKSLKTIHPDKMKLENNALRQKILDAYHQSKNRDHQRILERSGRIEERKEILEKMTIHRMEEEQKRQEQKAAEAHRVEEERRRLEREERDRMRQKERLQEVQQQHMKEKMQQIAMTDIGKKILDKMDEKEIAVLDTEQIMMKQVEELENEKRLLIQRLKNQEKKVDHFERAKRREEIPLLEAAIEKDKEEGSAIWKQREADRLNKALAERELAVATRDRLFRMKEDKDAFMSTLLKQRKAVFNEKLEDYNETLKKTRIDLLEERKKQRVEERRNKWLREQEEEEQRRRDEEAKRIREEKAKEEAERKAKEEEEYRLKKEALDAVARKQAEREREIEAKIQREKEEAMAARSTARDGQEDSNRGGWRSKKFDTRPGDIGSWRRRDAGASPNRERGIDNRERSSGGAWRASGGGGWRERERRKNEEWGPHHRDRRDEQPDDGGGGRGWRDDDGRGPRRGDNRHKDDDNYDGGYRRDDLRRHDDEDRKGPQRRDYDYRGPSSKPRYDDRDDRGFRSSGPPRGEDRRGGDHGRDGWRRDRDDERYDRNMEGQASGVGSRGGADSWRSGRRGAGGKSDGWRSAPRGDDERDERRQHPRHGEDPDRRRDQTGGGEEGWTTVTR